GFVREGSIEGLGWYRRRAKPALLPPGTAKVTFTSGTTGAPNGVALTGEMQDAVAASVAAMKRPLGIARHLCLLPFAVLLENVAGAMAAKHARIECIAPPLHQVGMAGSTGFDATGCLSAIRRHGAHSAIVLPQMLSALTLALEAGAAAPRTLRFLA